MEDLKWLQIPWLRQLFEATLGLSIALVTSWYAPDVWVASHLIFCGMFLIVFAVAIRYYTIAAYYASLLAATLHGLLLWWRPELHMQFSIPLVVFESSLLCVGGILASDLLQAQRRLSMLERQHTQIEERLQKTIRRYQTLLEMNAALEQQVSGLLASVAAISEKMIL